MKTAFGATACAGMLAAVMLAGCGGGSSEPDATAAMGSGRFVDSAVSGLSYVSGGTSGTTDATGSFQYEIGKTVTFSVGGVSLGTVTPKAIVTPVDLVTDATDETHRNVVNIARFLQTIDDDANPANGITISAAARTAAQGLSMNFAQDINVFEADADVVAAVNTITAATTSGARLLITAEAARDHLRSNLIEQLAGTYSGTFVGTFSGNFSVTINSAGSISGGGTDHLGDNFVVSGLVQSNGEGTFGAAGCATFSGSINRDTGALSGSWTGQCGSGTYSGKLQ